MWFGETCCKPVVAAGAELNADLQKPASLHYSYFKSENIQ